jgi:hypothetical protein
VRPPSPGEWAVLLDHLDASYRAPPAPTPTPATAAGGVDPAAAAKLRAAVSNPFGLRSSLSLRVHDALCRAGCAPDLPGHTAGLYALYRDADPGGAVRGLFAAIGTVNRRARWSGARDAVLQVMYAYEQDPAHPWGSTTADVAWLAEHVWATRADWPVGRPAPPPAAPRRPPPPPPRPARGLRAGGGTTDAPAPQRARREEPPALARPAPGPRGVFGAAAPAAAAAPMERAAPDAPAHGQPAGVWGIFRAADPRPPTTTPATEGDRSAPAPAADSAAAPDAAVSDGDAEDNNLPPSPPATVAGNESPMHGTPATAVGVATAGVAPTVDAANADAVVSDGDAEDNIVPPSPPATVAENGVTAGMAPPTVDAARRETATILGDGPGAAAPEPAAAPGIDATRVPAEPPLTDVGWAAQAEIRRQRANIVVGTFGAWPYHPVPATTTDAELPGRFAGVRRDGDLRPYADALERRLGDRIDAICPVGGAAAAAPPTGPSRRWATAHWCACTMGTGSSIWGCAPAPGTMHPAHRPLSRARGTGRRSSARIPCAGSCSPRRRARWRGRRRCGAAASRTIRRCSAGCAA